MKLAHLLDPYTSDIKAVLDHYKKDIRELDGGKTGLMAMHNLLAIARRNRAYDDTHPLFLDGTWPRILPYDGTAYCEYYENGCDDTHVATLLRKVKERLSSLEPVPAAK